MTTPNSSSVIGLFFILKYKLFIQPSEKVYFPGLSISFYINTAHPNIINLFKTTFPRARLAGEGL